MSNPVGGNIPNQELRQLYTSSFFFGIDLNIHNVCLINNSSFQPLCNNSKISEKKITAFTPPPLPDETAAKEDAVPKERAVPESTPPPISPEEKNDSNPSEQIDEALQKAEEEISNLDERLQQLERYFNGWKDDLDEYDKMQGFAGGLGRYLHSIIKSPLKPAFDSVGNHDTLIESIDDSFNKFLITSTGIGLDTVKLIVLSGVTRDLAEIKERFYTSKSNHKKHLAPILPLKPSMAMMEQTSAKIANIQHRLDNLAQETSEYEANTMSSSRKGLLRLVAHLAPYIIYPLASVAKSQLIKLCKPIHSIVKHGIKISNWWDLRNHQKEWYTLLQPRIRINKIEADDELTDSPDDLKDEILEFINSLEQCETIADVKGELAARGIKMKTPTVMVEWKHIFQKTSFKQELVQSYFHHAEKQPFMSTSRSKDQPEVKSDFEALLEKRRVEFFKKVDAAIPAILQQIDACPKETSLEDIKKHFATFNISLNKLKSPPKDTADWNEKKKELSVQKALATQWVEHQESLAQLSEQVMRQMLLSRNDQAHKFLCFSIGASIAHITTAVIQLGIACSNPFSLAMQWLVKDISGVIPAISFTTLLYPEATYRLVFFLITLVRQVFTWYYKPRECSFDGYKITLEVRWMKLAITLQSLSALIQQGLLWANIQLVERCILQKKSVALDNDPRSIQINEHLKSQRDAYTIQIKKLKKEQETLRSLNHAFSLFPEGGMKDDKVEKRTGTYYTKDEKKVHCWRYDPVETLAESLINGNIDFFPESTRTFIGKQLGMQLNNENKFKFVKKLRKLFQKEDLAFIGSFQENRERYLKA